MGHVKRSYGPSESIAKKHPHRTPLSIVVFWFCKSPDGGVGRRAPSGGDYLDKFEALYFHYYYDTYIYICFLFIFIICFIFIALTKYINQLKTGHEQSGLAASCLYLGLGS